MLQQVKCDDELHDPLCKWLYRLIPYLQRHWSKGVATSLEFLKLANGLPKYYDSCGLTSSTRFAVESHDSNVTINMIIIIISKTVHGINHTSSRATQQYLESSIRSGIISFTLVTRLVLQHQPQRHRLISSAGPASQ